MTSTDPPPATASDPDGSDGPHAFVDDVDAPVLSLNDRHHLARVVRLRPGASLTVGDGRGSWRRVRFDDPLSKVGPVLFVPAPTEPITVGFALVKGSRIDDVTRHLVELGVDVIVPFTSARCVVRWDESTAARRLERLRRIAVEAAMQCRRAWLPSVEPVTTYEDLVRRDGAVVAQMGAPALDRSARTVLIGPEGGFAPDEIDRAPTTASLGPHILRAETASLAAGTLLADRRAANRAATA